MTDLWLATANPKKRRELERMLEGRGYRVRGLDEAPGGPIDVVENGATFADNARKKASEIARYVGGLAVGDDSGLCVDALGGAPGVLSARWAGPDASDADRIDKLLVALADVPPDGRGAHFACAICLADPAGIVAEFEGRCDGRIGAEPRGTAGFGYDPVFVPDGEGGRTFAEIPAEAKDSISHRGRALQQLVEQLEQLEKRP